MSGNAFAKFGIKDVWGLEDLERGGIILGFSFKIWFCLIYLSFWHFSCAQHFYYMLLKHGILGLFRVFGFIGFIGLLIFFGIGVRVSETIHGRV